MNAVVVCNFDILDHPNSENAFFYSKILTELGYKTFLIGYDWRKEDISQYKQDNIECINIGFRVREKKIWQRIFERTKKVKKSINKYQTIYSEASIIIYLGDECGKVFFSIKKINPRAITICQICEWYNFRRIFEGTSCVKDFFIRTHRFIQNCSTRSFILVKNRNILTVSRLLKERYEQRKCICLQIPNLVSTEVSKIVQKDTNKLLFGYFGSPGIHNNKDLLNKIIYGIDLLTNDERSRIQFDIYGVTDSFLKKNCEIPQDLLVRLKDCIFAHGKIEKKQIKSIIQNFDFTLLLRADNYSMNSGLSSKMSESMSNGVPLITNLTSNMGDYIQDGYNGIVCMDSSPLAMAEGIRKALALSNKELYEMKCNSLISAKKFFNYKTYINDMKAFIKKIEQEEKNA